MSAITHIAQRLVVVATAAALAPVAPASASYGWPIKPFHQQHAVRSYFGDPRIPGRDVARGTFHFGIDISAPNGTSVYATLGGVAFVHPLHSDTVVVNGAGGISHEYWHVIPAITPGQHVTAYRTIVGHVEAPYRHVHFSERRFGTDINPLRPGALEPYRDTTSPRVQRIRLERGGELVAEAFDTQPIAAPVPWESAPLTPALVEWRVVGARSSRWQIAADFRGDLPRVPFTSVYAGSTIQNHADSKRSPVARYGFVLARSLPNGTYRIVVRVSDTAGNASQSSRTFTIANGV